MTNKLPLLYRGLSLAIISLLNISSYVNAANFDTLGSATQNSFDSMEQAASTQNNTSSSSILNSFQQSEADNKKDHYFVALDLLRHNKINEAQSKITDLLKKFPNEAQFYNLQALLETLRKDNVAAQENYQKSIAIDKNNTAAHLGLAKLVLDGGDLNAAKDYADKALLINDKLTGAYLILADIAYKQKNTTDAEKILRSGYEKIKGDIEQEVQLINTLGKFYVVQKQPEKLLSLAEDMVKRHKNNQALALLASAQIANTQYDLAEQTLTQIIKKDSQDITHRLLLAKLFSNKAGKEQETLQLLDETVKIDAHNPQAAVYKTAYFIKLKRSPEALALAGSIEKQFPALAIGKLLKGDVYLADKQLDKAIEHFSQAYKIEANTSVLFKIADIMQAQGKVTEAIVLLNTESAKDNKNNALHFKLATLYQQQNNMSQAQLHYETILNQQADNALVLNNLAWLYEQQNNPKALELAKKAYALAPDTPAIADTYGYILLKQGQLKEALVQLEKASSAAPKDNDIQYHLAEAYAVNDNTHKAIDILETIVKAEPDFSEKSHAETLLTKLKAH